MRRFIGKLLGTALGLFVGGPLGGFVGFVLGHINDLANNSPTQSKALEEDFFPDFPMNKAQRSVFAISVIILGAKLAKVDGKVTREEVLAFRRAFRTRDSQLAEVGRIFDKARTSAEGYEPYAARLAQTFGGSQHVLEEILFGLFYIAVADSPRLTRAEIVFLRRVAVIFGFSENEFQRIAARVGIRITKAQSKEKGGNTSSPPKSSPAYHLLGLPDTASDKDIKKTYRALIRKYHPDILVAQGVTGVQLTEATARMQKINAAYSELCKLRGIR